MSKGEIVISVPITLTKRHGRKCLIIPDGLSLPEETVKKDDSLILTILRAWKWNRMLEIGKATSAEALARQLDISPTYMGRVLRLNLLSPDIKLALLEGHQPKGLRVIDMLKPFPILWDKQREIFGFAIKEEDYAHNCLPI